MQARIIFKIRKNLLSVFAAGCSQRLHQAAKNIANLPISGAPTKYEDGSHLAEWMHKFREFDGSNGKKFSDSYYKSMVLMATYMGIVRRNGTGRPLEIIKCGTTALTPTESKDIDTTPKFDIPKQATVVVKPMPKLLESPRPTAPEPPRQIVQPTDQMNTVIDLIAIRMFERETGMRVEDVQKAMSFVTTFKGADGWKQLRAVASERLKQDNWREFVDVVFLDNETA
jgi:hypothetical protein